MPCSGSLMPIVIFRCAGLVQWIITLNPIYLSLLRLCSPAQSRILMFPCDTGRTHALAMMLPG